MRFFYSITVGFFSIFINELGDRTFILTALFSCNNSFWKVFIPCMTALILNCTISIVFGKFLLPLLLKTNCIYILSSLILFITGIWMIFCALKKIIHDWRDQESEYKELSTFDGENKSFNVIFITILLAEVGDKSQLAAFVLSASHVLL